MGEVEQGMTLNEFAVLQLHVMKFLLRAYEINIHLIKSKCFEDRVILVLI